MSKHYQTQFVAVLINFTTLQVAGRCILIHYDVFRIMYIVDSQTDFLGMIVLYDVLPEIGEIKKLTT
jgi:hypothetical protein